MGTDIKQLKSRITSLRSTMQLTGAMGLVASSKIKRSSASMLECKEYSEAFEEAVLLMMSYCECEESPYTKPRGGNRLCLVAIAGDRGLAGGYNANVFKMLREYSTAEIIPIGRRACERFGKKAVNTEGFSYAEAKKTANNICTDFLKGRMDKFGVVYTRYRSFTEQEATVRWLLPLQRSNRTKTAGAIFEPDELTVLNKVIPEYIAGTVFSCAKESFACEIAARRVAMDNAERNARKMTDKLWLEYNRARQSAITQELTEIVSVIET